MLCEALNLYVQELFETMSIEQRIYLPIKQAYGTCLCFLPLNYTFFLNNFSLPFFFQKKKKTITFVEITEFDQFRKLKTSHFHEKVHLAGQCVLINKS